MRKSDRGKANEPTPQPGEVAKPPQEKIGAGALQAFGRQGLKEIAQVLTAFPSGPVQVVEEPGQLGNLTPGAVDRQMKPKDGKAQEVKAVQQTKAVEPTVDKEPELDR